MPPVNDNFANAINIVISENPVVIETDNTGATVQSPEIEYGYNSIWYKIKSSKSILLSIDLSETVFDTIITVYTGSSFESLSEVAYNDDYSGSLQSKVYFYAEKDIEYYVCVSGYSETDFGYIKLTAGIVFCSDFSNIYSSNVSSGVAFLAGVKTVAVQDGSYPNYKLLFFEIDDSGYPVFSGQTSSYASLAGYFSYSEGKVITSRYPYKSLYIHNIDSYNVSSVQTVNIALSEIQYPEPGLGTAGQIKLNNDSLIIIFNDNDYNYVFFTAKINESSISYNASGVTDPIIPINTYFSYPTASCGCAVGIDKAIVCAEINENYVDKMVFIAVKSDGVVTQKSSPLQCSDIDGVPIMVSSYGNSFCLMYLVGNNIKFVYGEIDDDLNVLFSVPFSLGLSASNVSRSGSIIYEGAGNYTFLCNYYNNNSWNTLISSINIDNFVITKNDTERFFSETGQTGIVTFIGSQSLNRNILLTYGTGSSPLSNSGKLYSLSTWKTEDIEEAVEFWTNKILHKEGLSGMLTKQSTLTVTPGTPGQSYIPATPAIPSKTTFLHYTKKECKKVE